MHACKRHYLHGIKDEGQRMHGKLSQLAIPVHVRMRGLVIAIYS